jgi:hypothetical protein
MLTRIDRCRLRQHCYGRADPQREAPTDRHKKFEVFRSDKEWRSLLTPGL